ncbi:MAG: DUF4097 domain-containing protein [Bacteroidetes bacterium]|nr:DUF4097 domain-containing protein [Bacteroidota bacterium]
MKKTISILLFAIITVVCNAQSQEYSFSEKYNVEALEELSIDLEDGDISVFSSNESDIRINFIAKINKKLIKIDRVELEKHFSIEMKKSQNSIEIFSKPTQKENNKKWSNRIILSLELIVPNTTSCNLNTVDGDIKVKDLQANQKCKTIDGSIYLLNIKGVVSVTTSDGDVKFSDIEGVFTALSYDGNISGDLSVLKENLSLSTRDGDIEVTLPKGLGLNLDLRGDEIDTIFENFEGRIDDEYIIGKLNGGGIPVNISTRDGDLRLDFK